MYDCKDATNQRVRFRLTSIEPVESCQMLLRFRRVRQLDLLTITNANVNERFFPAREVL